MSAKSALSAPFFHDEAAAFVSWRALCGRMARSAPIAAASAGSPPSRVAAWASAAAASARSSSRSRSAPCSRRATSSSTCGSRPPTCLLCSSKKGFSAHQLHRTLGVTYKTAWFMAHRLREACATARSRPSAAKARWSRLTRPTSATRPTRRPASTRSGASSACPASAPSSP